MVCDVYNRSGLLAVVVVEFEVLGVEFDVDVDVPLDGILDVVTPPRVETGGWACGCGTGG